MADTTTTLCGTLISFFVGGLIGCAEIPVQPMNYDSIEASQDFSGWSDIRIGDCPAIEGDYQDSYDEIGVPQSTKGQDATLDVLLVDVLGGHQLNDRVPKSGESLGNAELSKTLTRDSFQILDQTETSFVFKRYYTVPELNREVFVNRRFDSKRGDFACEGGFVVLPRTTIYGGYEWGSINLQQSVRLRKTTDGSLIVYEQSGPFKATVTKHATDIRHRYFKFKPIIHQLTRGHSYMLHHTALTGSYPYQCHDRAHECIYTLERQAL